MSQRLLAAQSALNHHPLFRELKTPQDLRFFMESHVYAVWDFMSLLKRLQRDLTCVDLPWRPSGHAPELVRFINQIVVGEESDVDQDGRPCSHFELYLRAMEEVGAATGTIKQVVASGDLSLIPSQSRAFTEFTLHTAQHASTVEVAAAFFYGREKLIPGMFDGILAHLAQAKLSCPTLLYYLERHIHIDGEEHGPLSERCLEALCAGRADLREQSESYGVRALQERQLLWDRTLARMRS